MSNCTSIPERIPVVLRPGPEDRVADLLDELADLAALWKANRDRGVTPRFARGALLLAARDVLDAAGLPAGGGHGPASQA